MPKPDFSGTWRLDHDTSAFQVAAPDDSVFVIEHREPELHMERTHIAGERRDRS